MIEWPDFIDLIGWLETSAQLVFGREGIPLSFNTLWRYTAWHSFNTRKQHVSCGPHYETLLKFPNFVTSNISVYLPPLQSQSHKPTDWLHLDTKPPWVFQVPRVNLRHVVDDMDPIFTATQYHYQPFLSLAMEGKPQLNSDTRHQSHRCQNGFQYLRKDD